MAPDKFSFTLDLPEWAIEEHKRLPDALPNLEDRMAAVIEFSRKNFQNETGGPFAAGVFERETGKVVVIAVNRVMPQNCSSAHAEIMVLSLAQHILGTFDLGGQGMPEYQMLSTWRPCAMCYGAVPWSGIRELVVAGDGPELEEITGFDEGPCHPDWITELNKRGIDVINNVLRDKAIELFKEYAASNPIVYNGRMGERE